MKNTTIYDKIEYFLLILSELKINKEKKKCEQSSSINESKKSKIKTHNNKKRVNFQS